MTTLCKLCQQPLSARDRAAYGDRCEDCWVRDNGTWTASYKTVTIGEEHDYLERVQQCDVSINPKERL